MLPFRAKRQATWGAPALGGRTGARHFWRKSAGHLQRAPNRKCPAPCRTGPSLTVRGNSDTVRVFQSPKTGRARTWPELWAVAVRGGEPAWFWVVTGLIMVIPIGIVLLLNPYETRVRGLEEIEQQR